MRMAAIAAHEGIGGLRFAAPAAPARRRRPAPSQSTGLRAALSRLVTRSMPAGRAGSAAALRL
jgi:hypothetical protein